jgi:hypothetical protein
VSLAIEAVEFIVGVGERVVVVAAVVVVVVVVVVAADIAAVVVVGALVVGIVATVVIGAVERMDGVEVLVIVLGVLAVREAAEAGAAALDSLPIEISLSKYYYLLNYHELNLF